jgi:hypothetical protein
LGEFAYEAVGVALKIGMNIKCGADDGVKQNDGDEERKIPRRSR